QGHLVAARGRPAGVGSRAAADVENAGGWRRQVALEQFLRTPTLELEEARGQACGLAAGGVEAENGRVHRRRLLVHCATCTIRPPWRFFVTLVHATDGCSRSHSGPGRQ